MKIIKNGSVEKKTQAWWVGVRMQCDCGAVFELETGDEVRETRERRPNGLVWCHVDCPTCGQTATKQFEPVGYEASNRA